MFRFVFSLTPTLTWLVATAMMGSLAHTILSASKNIGVLEAIFLLVSMIGTCLCLFASYREARQAYTSHKNGTSFLLQKQAESQLVGAKAGNCHPMTEAQITHVKKLLASFAEAGLIDDGGDIALIGEMENESYEDDIGAYETLLSLRRVFIEHDMHFNSMVFTNEQVEVNEDGIKQLVQDLLLLVEQPISINDLNVNWPEHPQTTGSISIKLNNVEHNIVCQFYSKYTPGGLIEGIAGLFPHHAEPLGERLYWESLDSTLVVAKLTPHAAKRFNSNMEAFNDNFRFEPLKSQQAGIS